MLQRHRANDERDAEPDLAAKEAARIERLQRDAEQIRQWLRDNPSDRRGPRGKIRKSNRTDNDSAKMATDKRVIQGYAAVAAVDARAQSIVDAQAHGTGSGQALLLPIVEGFADLRDENSLVTGHRRRRLPLGSQSRSLGGSQRRGADRLPQHAPA
jgi:hypothetical protein